MFVVLGKIHHHQQLSRLEVSLDELELMALPTEVKQVLGLCGDASSKDIK